VTSLLRSLAEKYQRLREAREEAKEDTSEQPTPGSRGPGARRRRARREELLLFLSACPCAVLLPVSFYRNEQGSRSKEEKEGAALSACPYAVPFPVSLFRNGQGARSKEEKRGAAVIPICLPLCCSLSNSLEMSRGLGARRKRMELPYLPAPVLCCSLCHSLEMSRGKEQGGEGRSCCYSYLPAPVLR